MLEKVKEFGTKFSVPLRVLNLIAGVVTIGLVLGGNPLIIAAITQLISGSAAAVVTLSSKGLRHSIGDILIGISLLAVVIFGVPVGSLLAVVGLLLSLGILKAKGE